MSTAVKEINLKAIFALMNTNQAVVKIRPEKNSGLYGIWTHDLCDTSLTSQLGAGPQFIETIFINLQLFNLPLTGLFGTNIMTSSQLAYTTVRLSAFNYRCLQLTRLVQRRSFQITLTVTSPNVKDKFISMTQLQPWLIRLPFEFGEYGTSKHSLCTGWKKKSLELP